ncbi:MAG: 1,4-alpha-glucan branching protein GlgB [Nitrospirae bacterium]|nr:MAG: 1,4-alpha-glucan branching protein GlgB [Nitrospirota bacterium]
MGLKREINALCKGNHGDPFRLLGMHNTDSGVVVRAFLPMAAEVWVLAGPDIRSSVPYAMEKVHDEGLWEFLFQGKSGRFSYTIKMRTHWGELREFVDPYGFSPVLTDYDLHLLCEGNHYRSFEKLGAHVMEVGGVKGVHFAVWAPNAERVSVTADFNGWDGRVHVMRRFIDQGFWEIFIPGVEEGTPYKFEVKGIKGYLEYKTDPYAFLCELRPKTAAVVYTVAGKHKWHDKKWLEKRKNTFWHEAPVSIYELHLGSWMRYSEEENDVLNYRELADKLVPYVKELGYTHIELLPVSEYPLDASWGYQVIGYFAPTSRFGRPEDFMYFVDKFHQSDIGVIMDWVPAHFPRDAHGLAFFDGTHLYDHADPKKGEHVEWGTLIFNYGRNEVKNFLISNALFWIDKYHIDGLRVDAVASMLYLDYAKKPDQWIPNKYGGRENLEAIDFVRRFNEVVHGEFPGVLTIAEESTSWPNVTQPTYVGGLGFSMKWNMGWMHDTLKYFSKDPVHRKHFTYDLTFSMMYAFSENFVLPISHDEVVYGKRSMLSKMPGDMWRKFANLRALYGFMYGHPGKKLLFMGSEFGQWIEWCFFKSLDWHITDYEQHKKLMRFVSDLNRLYRSEPAFYEIDYDWRGFEWIDLHDHDRSVMFFIRRAKDPDDFLVFAFNFTPVPRYHYRIGVPADSFYKELLNSDSGAYWGGNMGNMGGVHADKIASHGRPYSIRLTLPPLSVLILKPHRK